MTRAEGVSTSFPDCISESMEAMRPGTTIATWAKTTRAGRLLSIARGMTPAQLDAWICLAEMMTEQSQADREAAHVVAPQ